MINTQSKKMGTLLVLAISLLLLAACAAQTVEVTRVVPGEQVEVTRVVQEQVEVVVTKIVAGDSTEVVVTATPEPVVEEPAELNFTVWIGPDHPAMVAYTQIADAYMAENPNVTAINFQTIAFAEYTSKVVLQLAGSNPPDGGWVLEATAPQFLSSGVLSNLSPALAEYPDYKFEDFSQPALGLWTTDNNLYGLPFSTSPFLTIYNADMFAAAGLETPRDLAAKGEWTWDALREAAAMIASTQGVYGFESGDGAIYNSVWGTMTPIIRAQGGDAWDKEGNCLLNAPESVAAFQLYHDMVYLDKSAVPPGEIGDFYSGQSAMTLGQISRLTKLDGAEFAWDVAPMPTGPAGDASTIGQAGFVIYENSKNLAAAQDFIAFLTNAENSAIMGQFFPSARLSVLNSDAFLTGNERLDASQMQYVVDGIANGRILPSHPNFSKIDLAAKGVTDNLWSAEADVQAVLDELCTTIAPLLLEN